MKRTAEIFWCTGLSGAGKSTLAEHAKLILQEQGISVLSIDGDAVRGKYKMPVGFSRNDIQKNNLKIFSFLR